MIGTLTQGHELPVVAPAAILRGVGRIDFDKLSASFFRFAGQLRKEGRPRGICNAFGQTMIMQHSLDLQIFHADHPKTVNNLPTLLMGEIVPFEGNPLMDSRNHLPMLAAFSCALGQFGEFPLSLCQCLLFLAEKPGVLNCFGIGKGGKGFEPNINPHRGRGFWQSFRLTLHREGDIPFACRGTLYRTGFHLPPDRAMIDHVETANFRETDPFIMGDAKATLGEGERVIAARALETGKAGFLSLFSHSAKEGLEGQIDTHGHILQHLGMHILQSGMRCFQDREGCLLLIQRQRLPLLLIRMLAAGKQVIIEPATLFQGFVEPDNLLFCGENPILKHFKHSQILAQSSTDVNKQGIPIPSSIKGRALHPRHEWTRLSSPFTVKYTALLV